MRNTLRRALFATTVAAAAFGFAATSASATALAQWTVSNPNTNGAFSAHLKAGTTAELLDNTTGQGVSCSTAAASGTANSGVHSGGSGLASISSATWGTAASTCAGPLGSTFTASLTSGTIKLNGASYAGGVTSGNLTDVNVTITGDTLFGVCTATITGSAANAKYTNSTGQLSIVNGTGLTIATANNCSGLMNAGDAAQFSATYVLDKPITVTSP
ncbi:hypothetical protein OG520_05905 [Streptomyces sp. NBC_00984]|uniref:hypothetical protein n=1 Tax=Streptomyces sp. NBC_00984 TaxID=2903700 RepID=UPI0038650EDB|nr:hypothetical protein OG520_05905 [Streptomyces sp. NBC_00984]